VPSRATPAPHRTSPLLPLLSHALDTAPCPPPTPNATSSLPPSPPMPPRLSPFAVATTAISAVYLRRRRHPPQLPTSHFSAARHPPKKSRELQTPHSPSPSEPFSPSFTPCTQSRPAPPRPPPPRCLPAWAAGRGRQTPRPWRGRLEAAACPQTCRWAARRTSWTPRC